ncbi:MFS transporter [Marinobacterium iners]|uniref:Predicted arabinose efflux permease, MFS family n=1 Tax=Marinobacterium iners DSM 11526 TaxID=1122198 RepID=A0A1H4G8X7_9GAMM|nr:MFS transporter [Marinobacterium iners]SEB05731.1 Predicted arabinose efflux permease, MFS family [Marinobacterium iners DSM 11526]
MLKYFISNKLPAGHPLTYLFLAFITMVGLSYINFMPGFVNALAGNIGFNEAEAGQIVALNGYGGLIGSTIAIFLVRRIQWQPAMFLFLVLLSAIDLSTIWLSELSVSTTGSSNYTLMLGWRFLAGTFGGLSLGIGFAVLARLNNPDRAFGTLLFIQFSIGSIVMYFLPELEAQLSAYAVFYVMAAFVLMSLAILPFLPALSLKYSTSNQPISDHTASFSGTSHNALLLMLAIITYQIAASAIWAYVGLIGLGANISNDDVSMYIATTGLLGVLGAMLPVISGNRYGRLYWIMAGIGMSMVSAIMLSASQLTPLLYVIAMSLLFFSWPAIQSYLLAVTAEQDTSGKLSTIAAVVSSIGLASGPLIASGFLNSENFSLMLYVCIAIFVLSFILLLKPVQAQEQERSIKLPAQYPS